MNISKIFMVDPMSYNNLSLYDKSLIEKIEVNEKVLLGNNSFEYSDCNNNFKFIPLYKYNKYSGLLKILSYLVSQVRLLFQTIIQKPEIIHFQWVKIPRLDVFIIFLIKKINPKIKIIYTAHNILPHENGDTFKHVYKKLYQSVDRIIVHDSFSKNELINQFNIDQKLISVIPHGLLKSNVNTKKEKAENQNLVFSVLGKLSKYKGVDLVIDAWLNCEYLSNNQSLKLILGGRPTEDIKQKIEEIKRIPNVVVLDDFLEEEKFQTIIEESDVILLPYRNISQSGVLLTALANRKAVLVSKVGGLTQPFEIGTPGWVLNSLNIENIADKLKHISENRNELNEINSDEKLWGKIFNYYSWEKIGNKTLNVYND